MVLRKYRFFITVASIFLLVFQTQTTFFSTAYRTTRSFFSAQIAKLARCCAKNPVMVKVLKRAGIAFAGMALADNIYQHSKIYQQQEFDYEPKNEINVDQAARYRNLACVLHDDMPRVLPFLIKQDVPLDVVIQSLITAECAPILIGRTVLLSFVHRYELDLKNWDVLYAQGHFLLIPQQYKDKIGEENLGFDLRGFTQINNKYEGCNFYDPDIKKLIDFTDDQLGLEDLAVDLDSNNQFELLSSLLSSSKKDHNALWNIGFFGHGSAGKSVSGIKIENFKKILTIFDSFVTVNTVFYNTCSGASKPTKNALLQNRYSFPIFSVGGDTFTLCISNVLIDIAALYKGFEVDRDRCCWKEVATQNFYDVVSYAKYDTLKKFSPRSKYVADPASWQNELNAFPLHVISCLVPGLGWIHPQGADKYELASAYLGRKHKVEKIRSNKDFFCLDQKDIDATIELTNLNQKLVSVVPGDCEHRIKELRVPSIKYLLCHFGTYRPERVSKVFVIETLIECDERGNQQNRLNNVVISLPKKCDDELKDGYYRINNQIMSKPFKLFDIAEKDKHVISTDDQGIFCATMSYLDSDHQNDAKIKKS